MLYDSILIFALLMLATIPFVAVRGGESVEPAGSIAFQLTLAAVIFGYFVGYWTWKGRTLGMQSWGVQLETADGKIPGLPRATVRFFAALLSWAVVGIGFLWQLVDPDDLAWHDRLSGTRLRHYPKSRQKN